MNLDMGVYLRISLFSGQLFGLNGKNRTLSLPTAHCPLPTAH